jgi:hypothetical protein
LEAVGSKLSKEIIALGYRIEGMMQINALPKRNGPHHREPFIS